MARSTKAVLPILLSLVVFLQLPAAYTANYEFQNWEVKSGREFVRYFGRGDTVSGHQFGFVRSHGNCQENILWISWSTDSRGLEALKGITTSIELTLGRQKFQLEIPIASIHESPDLPTMIAFTNFMVNNDFIALLEGEKKIGVTILSPKQVLDQFDMATDSFSFSGFQEAVEKSYQVCSGEVDSYYERSCSDQAEDVRKFAAYRDKGYSKQSVMSLIQERYQRDFFEVYESQVEWIFSLPSSSPAQLYQTALNDCESRGEAPESPSIYMHSGKAQGYLGKDKIAKCLKLSGELNDARARLASHEKQLDALNTQVQLGYKRLNTQSNPSNFEINEYNTLASRFEQMVSDYDQTSARFNKDTEWYNRNCGGMAEER